jgi:DNA polymerase II large subunit
MEEKGQNALEVAKEKKETIEESAEEKSRRALTLVFLCHCWLANVFIA